MSIAGRHRKLTETVGHGNEDAWRGREDLLTADVFGAYRYLPFARGTQRLLARAVDEKATSLEHWLAAHGVRFDSLTDADVRFWPRMSNRREPDALILLGTTNGAPSVALLMEAKLHSGQHPVAERSQLGHYCRDFGSKSFAFEDDFDLPGLRAALYVTNHPEIPTDELSRARAELAGVDVGIFWVSWETALTEAERQLEQAAVALEPGCRRLLEDLAEDLRARGVGRRRAPHDFMLPLLDPLGRHDDAFISWRLR